MVKHWLVGGWYHREHSRWYSREYSLPINHVNGKTVFYHWRGLLEDYVLEDIIRPLVSVLPLTWFIGRLYYRGYHRLCSRGYHRLCSRGYHPPTPPINHVNGKTLTSGRMIPSRTQSMIPSRIQSPNKPCQWDCALEGIIRPLVNVLPLTGFIGGYVLEGIIRPLVGVLPLTWFIGRLYSREYLQSPNKPRQW
jgi:hypothetical protein